MDKKKYLQQFIEQHPDKVGKVVDFEPDNDRLLQLDFSDGNHELRPEDIANTPIFSSWVQSKLQQFDCKYGIGGYFEHRTLYARSALFTQGDEPRCVHLGVDIWAEAGTAVYSPFAGKVHSFSDNNQFGDYGPTIIIEHQFDELELYSLYGHLNREALAHLYVGKPIEKNQIIGSFGQESENGNWPPHLHFQLMFDMGGMAGDYPGVCRVSDQGRYFRNIPDPAIVLQFPGHAIISLKY